MDKNHQNKTESKPIATEDVRWVLNRKSKLWVPQPKKPFVERMGFAGKTPWDLIQLLLIPLVLAGVGYWFSARQHETDVQIATNQQQEAVLVNYQKDISDLLLNFRLGSPTEGNSVRQIARTKTLTALRQLDPLRKGLLIQFLYEAQLIIGQSPTISLRDADLSDISLGSNIGLKNRSSVYAVPVGESNHCHLEYINLDSTDLKGAYLRNAGLSNASLMGTYLDGADLSAADLSGVNLKGAKVSQEQLKQVQSLKGTTMPDGSKHP